jgi:hypothetical protein
MQAFVIRWRERARLYLASGWIGAIEGFKNRLNPTYGRVYAGPLDPQEIGTGTFRPDREMRGGVDIIETPTSIRIEIWNSTRGIVEMDRKHRILDKALTARAADMIVYIRRKIDEARREIFGRAG